jgi:hypothetical protein
MQSTSICAAVNERRNPSGKAFTGRRSSVKPLAAEYYRLTKKPLGVTGEVAEYVAAECLNLKAGRLVKHRSGVNALVALSLAQRAIRFFLFSSNATLEPCEMWEASYKDVVARLAEPRNQRGALSVHDFKRLAFQIWPERR